MKASDSQGGFSLISAIFILVVLSAIGGYMVTIGGTQRTTNIAAIQGARAFQAARSGMEWAITRATIDPDCSNINNSFTLNVDGLNGFKVVLTCAMTQHLEAGNTINIFTLTSQATSGNFGEIDFVRRQLTATISPPALGP